MRTANEIRNAVKQIYGSENARVTRYGEVEVRGEMPNSDKVGWYLKGYVGSPELESDLFDDDGSVRAD